MQPGSLAAHQEHVYVPPPNADQLGSSVHVCTGMGSVQRSKDRGWCCYRWGVGVDGEACLRVGRRQHEEQQGEKQRRRGLVGSDRGAEVHAAQLGKKERDAARRRARVE